MSLGPPLSRRACVLLRLPDWLGDFVMSEPLLRALDEHLAAGALTLAARAPFLALLEGRFPRAGRLALGERESARDGARAWRGHDAALLCTGSFRSAWNAWRARIPRRIGFARDGRRALLTDALRPARERGATPLGLGVVGRGRRYLPRPLERSLAELAGLVGVAVPDLRPRLVVADAWRGAARVRRARLGLGEDEPYVLANVGARAGSAKGFPPELWSARLAALESRVPLPLVLVCGPGEEPALAAARAGLRDARGVLDPPAELPELAALCAEARLVLTVDAGPRHVARAVGTAVLCLAGPTDPRHTSGERGREVLVRTPVDCGPCHRERCPLGGTAHHACMTGIDGAAWLAAAERLLGA